MNEPNRVPVGCPSEFSLERLRLAELEPLDAMPLMNHVQGCLACGRRLEELSVAPPPFDLDRVWNAARAEAHVPHDPEGRRWFRRLRQRWMLTLTATAAVAAAVAALLLRPAPPPTDVVKGSPWTFAVLVKRHGQERVTRPLSGVRLSSGDRLRFEVATKVAAGYVAVIGADSRGAVGALVPVAGTSVAVRGERPVVLDGAVELDDAPGAERIDMLGCARPFSVEDLTRAAGRALKEGRGDLRRVDGVLPGCYQETFWIEKVNP